MSAVRIAKPRKSGITGKVYARTAGRNKYGNKRTLVNGISFQSAKEAKRYGELLLLERAEKIHTLTLQPRIPCNVDGIRVCIYVGDFKYCDFETGRWVVEDAKGFRTPIYKLKKKLVLACTGITITEV